MAVAAYNGSVRVRGGGAGSYAILAGVNDVSISLSRNLIDVSQIDGSSDFTKRLGGLKDFPITISGFFDATDTAYGHLKANFVSGTQIDIQVYFDPTLGAGNTGFECASCLVESMEFSASVDGAQEASFTIQSNATIAFTS